MNILFPYLARWRSANWSRYHQLLGALCHQGHRVHVLEAPPRPGSQETNYTDMATAPLPEGMAVHEIPVPLWGLPLPLDKFAKKGLLTLATWRYVRRMVREQRIDVLLLYNLPQFILSRAASDGCKVVFDVADDLLAMFAVEVGRWQPVLQWPTRWAFDCLVHESDLVTTPALTLAEQLPDHVCLVPNGVDPAAARRADGRAIRAAHPGPIVGFVGAFEYFVDLDLLLSTAALLPRVKFLLVGTGRQWARVAREVQTRGLSNVILPGAVPYPKNLDYVQAMDVCLVPFAAGPVGDHSAPLKLFEYLALGKPVVTTPLKEVQVIAGDVVGMARGAEETAAAIEDVFARPDVWRKRAGVGLERVRTMYNWDLIARDLAAKLECL